MAGKRGVYDNVAIDLAGNALNNIEVTVTDHSDNAVTIYTSKSGGVKTNPFTTDSTGVVYFWAPPGSYKVKYHDLNLTPRISDRTTYWESLSGDSEGIDGSQIAQATMSGNRLIDDTVTLAKMANNSVGTNELIDDSVTNAEIAANAVGGTEIAAFAVSAGKSFENNRPATSCTPSDFKKLSSTLFI